MTLLGAGEVERDVLDALEHAELLAGDTDLNHGDDQLLHADVLPAVGAWPAAQLLRPAR